MFLAAEQGVVEHQNANHTCQLVADSHNAHTAGCRFNRADNGDVWIAGSLQKRQAAALQEEPQQKHGVAAHLRARDEHHAADGHDDQAQSHSVAVARLLQHK